MYGHLLFCNTLRLIYSRFTAILGALTCADALALAKEPAPIEDLLVNVSLLFIQNDNL